MKRFKEFIKEHVTSTGRWGNAGAGILPYCPETKRFLVALRSSYVFEPNTWGIWGGKVDDEDMDDIEQTAIREFQEESRYMGDIKLVPSYVYKERGFTYYNFIGIVEDEFEPILNWEQEDGYVETDDYEWMTFERMSEITPKHFGLTELIKNNKHQMQNL